MIFLKYAKSFRQYLDNAFLQYPPVFLHGTSHSINSQGMVLGEKMRYYERLLKYSKKAQSLIDMKAVRLNVVKEKKKYIDELRRIGMVAVSTVETDFCFH
jgi:hypothetical protein